MKGVLAEREKTQAREITIYTKNGMQKQLRGDKANYLCINDRNIHRAAKLSQKVPETHHLKEQSKKSSIVSKEKWGKQDY